MTGGEDKSTINTTAAGAMRSRISVHSALQWTETMLTGTGPPLIVLRIPATTANTNTIVVVCILLYEYLRIKFFPDFLAAKNVTR